jgi:hypothetical protein
MNRNKMITLKSAFEHGVPKLFDLNSFFQIFTGKRRT